MTLNIKDVREAMPNYDFYKDWHRSGEILGIAIHHSATANRLTGAPVGDAATFFNYHVNTRGWAHGGYNYVITGTGEIEYALDDGISAYHAGFKDPDDSEGLEYGQFWDNHYLAICLAGWFSEGRTYRDESDQIRAIPNNDTHPSEVQLEALISLVQDLRQKYNIPIGNVRGHRELAGTTTVCPGLNFNPADLREKLRLADQPLPEPERPDPESQPQVAAGEHVVLLPDTDKYLDSALAYIWKFQPDVSFAIDEAAGRWKYITAVGDENNVSRDQLIRLRDAGAILVQRIGGSPTEAQETLDSLVARDIRFLEAEETPDHEITKPEFQDYTVQPGDSLSRIAFQFYGKSSLWRVIFEANQHILTDPSTIRVGSVLRIPTQPR